MSTLEPRIIKTDEQHCEFLAEVERLASLDPEPESLRGLRLELLARLVEDYEKARFAFAKPDPIDSILFRMEQQGLRQKDIAPYLGGKNRASEVLSRKRSLTLPMIRALNEKLDIPPGLLIREPKAEYAVRKVRATPRMAEPAGSGPSLRGFEGFLPLRTLLADAKQAPAVHGVYVIVRKTRTPPGFQKKSSAGWFKGKDPSYSLDVLTSKWVPGADIIYIGKAGPAKSRTLRKRICELVRFGDGRPVAVCQLPALTLTFIADPEGIPLRGVVCKGMRPLFSGKWS